MFLAAADTLGLSLEDQAALYAILAGFPALALTRPAVTFPETLPTSGQQMYHRPVDVDVTPTSGATGLSERTNLVPNELWRQMRLIALLHDVEPVALTYQTIKE